MDIREALQIIEDDGINLGAGDFVDTTALKVAGAVLHRVNSCPKKGCYAWCGHFCPLSTICAVDRFGSLEQMYHYADGKFRFVG